MSCIDSNEIDVLRNKFRIKAHELINDSNGSIPYGYIYMITSKIDGSTYIGQRKYTIDYTASRGNGSIKGWRRYLSSGVDVHRLIGKYNNDIVVKTFICYVDSKVLLDKVETLLIRYGKTIHECTMNHAIVAPFPNCLIPEEDIGAKITHLRAEAKYRKEVVPLTDKIIHLYKNKHKSQNYIAQKLHIDKRKIARCLHENHVATPSSSDKAIYQQYICKYCGKKFTRRQIKHSSRIKYCSKQCSQLGYRKLDDCPVEKLQELYSSGMSLHEIEDHLGNVVSYITIYNRLRVAGVVFRKKGRNRLS